MTPVPKNSMAFHVRLISGKRVTMPSEPGSYDLTALPFEAIPPFRVMCVRSRDRFVTWEQELASCTSREAALAAMRLLGVTEYEDWTS